MVVERLCLNALLRKHVMFIEKAPRRLDAHRRRLPSLSLSNTAFSYWSHGPRTSPNPRLMYVCLPFSYTQIHLTSKIPSPFTLRQSPSIFFSIHNNVYFLIDPLYFSQPSVLFDINHIFEIFNLIFYHLSCHGFNELMWWKWK